MITKNFNLHFQNIKNIPQAIILFIPRNIRIFILHSSKRVYSYKACIINSQKELNVSRNTTLNPPVIKTITFHFSLFMSWNFYRVASSYKVASDDQDLERSVVVEFLVKELKELKLTSKSIKHFKRPAKYFLYLLK